MPLSKLSLTNFRCFPALSLDLPRQLVITGANGRGKSSILEAITLLALTRSTRAHSDAELVRTSEQQISPDPSLQKRGTSPFRKGGSRGISELENMAIVEGVLGPRKVLRLTIELQGNRVVKRANRFGRTVPLSELVGSVRTVLFSPEDMELFTGPPRLRRRLVDGLLLQRDGSAYATELQTLHRTLKQRNTLLAGRGSIEALRTSIGVWDFMLAEVAQSIIGKRAELTRALEAQTTATLASMDIPLSVTIRYRSTVPEVERLGELLAARLERDRDVGATTVGPHRDDLDIVANGRPLAAASRGEQRAVLVALKLAEYELLQQATGDEPLFLIDDVFSELDPVRRAQVASRIANRPCIATSADPSAIPSQLSSFVRHEL